MTHIRQTFLKKLYAQCFYFEEQLFPIEQPEIAVKVTLDDKLLETIGKKTLDLNRLTVFLLHVRVT